MLLQNVDISRSRQTSEQIKPSAGLSHVARTSFPKHHTPNFITKEFKPIPVTSLMGYAGNMHFLLCFLLNNNHDVRLEYLYRTTNGDHGYRTNEEQTGRQGCGGRGERRQRHDASLVSLNRLYFFSLFFTTKCIFKLRSTTPHRHHHTKSPTLERTCVQDPFASSSPRSVILINFLLLFRS